MTTLAQKLGIPAAIPDLLRIKFRQGFFRLITLGIIVNALTFSMFYSYVEATRELNQSLADLYESKYAIFGGLFLFFYLMILINRLAAHPIRFNNGSEQYFLLAPISRRELISYGLWNTFIRMDSTLAIPCLFMPGLIAFFGVKFSAVIFIISFAVAAEWCTLAMATVFQRVHWLIRLSVKSSLSLIAFTPVAIIALELQDWFPLSALKGTKLFLAASHWLGLILTGQRTELAFPWLLGTGLLINLGFKITTQHLKMLEVEDPALDSELENTSGLLQWLSKNFEALVKWTTIFASVSLFLFLEGWELSLNLKHGSLNLFSPVLLEGLGGLCFIALIALPRLRFEWTLPAPSYAKILRELLWPSLIFSTAICIRSLLFIILAIYQKHEFSQIWLQAGKLTLLAIPIAFFCSGISMSAGLVYLKIQQKFFIAHPFLRACFLLIAIPTFICCTFLLVCLVYNLSFFAAAPIILGACLLVLFLATWAYEHVDLT